MNTARTVQTALTVAAVALATTLLLSTPAMADRGHPSNDSQREQNHPEPNHPEQNHTEDRTETSSTTPQSSMPSTSRPSTSTPSSAPVTVADTRPERAEAGEVEKVEAPEHHLAPASSVPGSTIAAPRSSTVTTLVEVHNQHRRGGHNRLNRR